MRRTEIDQRAYWLRWIVQLAVLTVLLIETNETHLRAWISGIILFTLLSNRQLMLSISDEKDWKRLLWLTLEWSAIISVFVFVPYSPYFILFIILVVTAAIAIDTFWIRILFVITFGMSPVLHQLYLGTFNWQLLMTFFLLILFFLMFSSFFRQFEAQQVRLQELNRQLEAYAKREKEWALEQERNRIARELHDTVAHQSTGLIVQLQKLRMANNMNRDEDARQSLDESEHAARKMLNDMRKSVRMISPLEGSVSPFEELFSDFETNTDMRITSNGIHHFYDLPLKDQAGVYSICQEALTNAKRHGHAKRVSIHASRTGKIMNIHIQDDGTGLPEDWSMGFGLRKMKDDLEIRGGVLHISEDQGLSLEISYPLTGGVSDD